MKRIASFQIDHNKLTCGMYVSRVDGDIVTYDIRTRRPNVEPCLLYTSSDLRLLNFDFFQPR